MQKLENRRSARRTRRALLCCVTLLSTLTACESHPRTAGTNAPPARNIGCLEFTRGTYSRLHDTLPTIAWVKSYNAARDKVCGAGK